ncbi:glycosyltransferase family 4 protein [Intrasporangium calvum]|uniref:D-inositol 3-phosphate glycosyltransferase n=1 Tax=Intrasporangium calvum TaxID=53358 RepID=A0ABT5GHE4_9MICO|nr:glycosyltransferase family 4 protein [Intrasporangium calvum]MDC5697678.1 glycosyltransferase family 4 protein [Intrasporangium calvum]
MDRRIALVASSFDPHTGGVEEHVRHVARVLAARGHHVVVWTVDRGEHLGARDMDGFEVRYLPTPLPARSLRALLTFGTRLPAAVMSWVGAYLSFRPEILHVHCFGPNGVYALALSRLTGTPLVVSGHGETFMDDDRVFEKSALLRRALRLAGRRAAAVTACSTMVAEALETGFGTQHPHVVPNGVELDARAERAPQDPPTWWPLSTVVVGAVGRIEQVKGFDLLVRAFASVRRPGEHLVIAGDGAALPRLAALVEELDAAEAVVLPGRISRPEVAWLMEHSTVVVVPSRVEAFGIVALEAWRGGSPLLLTENSGARDVVTDGVDAFLVDPTDLTALGAAIRRVVDDPDTSSVVARNGHMSVQAYSWERVCDDYIAIYDVVLPKAPQ